MKTLTFNKSSASLRIGAGTALALLLSCVAAFLLGRGDSSRLKTALETAMAQTRLVQTMRSELLASAEAEKSAVMADTDETSKAYAEQSREASRRVESARVALGALLKKGGDQARLFNELSTAWEKLREIDEEILSLAVQNTNLKALHLSFVPASEALGRMEKAMSGLMSASLPSPRGAEIIRQASEALVGALAIHVLESPHIAETTDEGMDRIQAEMSQRNEQVRKALIRLDDLAEASARPELGEARKAYDDFMAINTEIIELSRRNSNIRSFAVSLGQKRNIMARCLDLLNGLEEAVGASATFRATR